MFLLAGACARVREGKCCQMPIISGFSRRSNMKFDASATALAFLVRTEPLWD